MFVVSVPFEISDANTKEICSGQEEKNTLWWRCLEVFVEQVTVVVDVDWFGTQNVLGERLSIERLTEQKKKQNQTTT